MDANKKFGKGKRKRSDEKEEIDSKSKKLKKVDGKTDEPVKFDTTILQLPDDVLIRIIELLPINQWPHLELVARQFSKAVYGAWYGLKKIQLDEELSMDRRKGPVDGLNSILEKLLLRSPNISNLSGFGRLINNDRQSITEASIDILSKFDSLEVVCFTYGEISPKDFGKFLSNSQSRHRLKEINYIESRWRYVPVIFADFKDEDSDRLMLKLEKLRCSFAYYASSGFLDFIDASSLTTVSLFDTSIVPQKLNFFLNRCSKNIDHLELPLANNGLCIDKDLLKKVASFEKLSILKVDFRHASNYVENDPETYSEFRAMIKEIGNRGRLTEFSLNSNWFCTDEIITSIADHLFRLLSIEIQVDKCHAASLIWLVTNLKDLKKLRFISSSFKKCKEVNAAVIKALSTNASNLESVDFENLYHHPKLFNDLVLLTNLKELRVGHFFGDGKFTGVTLPAYTLKAWGKGVGWKLESLDLSRCKYRCEFIFNFEKIVWITSIEFERRSNYRRWFESDRVDLRESARVRFGRLSQYNFGWSSSDRRRLSLFEKVGVLRYVSAVDQRTVSGSSESRKIQEGEFLRGVKMED